MIEIVSFGFRIKNIDSSEIRTSPDITLFVFMKGKNGIMA